jgi:hypothetical protein
MIHHFKCGSGRPEDYGKNAANFDVFYRTDFFGNKITGVSCAHYVGGDCHSIMNRGDPHPACILANPDFKKLPK